MNEIQNQVINYMREVLSQEDEYVIEAWFAVEAFVMDALEESLDNHS